MRAQPRVLVSLMCAVGLLVGTPSAAHAYLGPGGVLSGIGAFLALIAVLFAAVFGFIWFPVKRLVRRMQARKREQTESHEPVAGSAGSE